MANTRITTLIHALIGTVLVLAYIPIFIFDWNFSNIDTQSFVFKDWALTFIGKVFYLADLLLATIIWLAPPVPVLNHASAVKLSFLPGILTTPVST